MKNKGHSIADIRLEDPIKKNKTIAKMIFPTTVPDITRSLLHFGHDSFPLFKKLLTLIPLSHLLQL